MAKKKASEEKALTFENLRFQVAYTVSKYWDFPEIDGEHFEWEGEERVEQSMFGVLNARQFLWLVLDGQLEESISTQGLQIQGGYIIPAVDVYTADEERRCFVSVYTDTMLAKAVEAAEKPAPTPVLQNDFTLKAEILSFADGKAAWMRIIDEIPLAIHTIFRVGCGIYMNEEDLDDAVIILITELNLAYLRKDKPEVKIKKN